MNRRPAPAWRRLRRHGPAGSLVPIPVFATRLLLLGAALVLLGACSRGWRMERAAPVASYCPQEIQPQPTSAPPDTLALRWYRAVTDRDLELSSRWCATVGRPVIDLSPAGPAASWTEGDGLQVLTWNVQVGAGDLVTFLEAEAGISCGGAAGRSVEPVVVLVQEAWRRSEELPVVEEGRDMPWPVDPDRGPDGGQDIVSAAETCGLALVYVPSARNGPDSGPRPREDKGNAVLSTLPLTAPIAIDLPFEAGRKVAVAATVVAPGGERVRVASAHLDVASTLWRTLTSGNQTRARQAAGLIDGLRKAERDGPLNAVTVVGGDFNTLVANESAIKRMIDAFPESPQWDGRMTWRPLSLPVDHIFFRRGPFDHIRVEGYGRLDEHHGSDHFGRRLTVRYDAPPANGAASRSGPRR